MIEVIGVGASGLCSLGPAERRLVDEAEVVVGGERHLAMLDGRSEVERIPWPSPLRQGLDAVLERVHGRRTVVLASGDPLVSGVGATLLEAWGRAAVRIHPNVSSVALARARMGWAAEDSDAVTIVGRDVDRLRRSLSPRARLIVLTSGEDGPSRIARLLVEEGYAASPFTVLGDLGAASETRTEGVAGSWDDRLVPRLHLVCIECRRDFAGPLRSLAPGLDDASFENDGQLTKRLVRAAALAHLAPQPRDVMWDLGAGAGSVGIEFARLHPRIAVHAVERDPQRAERIRRNARRLGVPGLVVHEGASADVVTGLPEPDAIFIGGGGTSQLVDRCWAALAPGGRLVAHAVSVETERVLFDAHERLGGRLARISIEDLEPLGSLNGWRPSRAVTQWSTEKLVPQANPKEGA